MNNEVFINLPVADLEAAKDFYSIWGWKNIPEFTDGNAACMNFGGNVYVMLITKEFFPTFIDKPIADTSTHSTAIYCLGLPNADDVTERADAAIAAGGTKGKELPDMGMPDMHIRNFFDLDGHAWELMHMPVEQ